MADFNEKNIRTIGIFGGDGCGKTTLVDALMYTAGANSRQGSVDQGTSISDTDEEEKARGGSIRSTPLQCSFEGNDIFLVDTPGYADFWGEVILTMEVVDSALIVVDGLSGADVTTRRIWDLARSKNVPVALFINKLDKEHSSFGKALEGVESSLNEKVIPLVLPDADHPGFSAAYSIYDEENISKITVPAAAGIDDSKEKLIEAAAETDDSLIEKYLETGSLDPAEVNAGLKKAFARAGFTPLFSGAAVNCVGVTELLQSFAEFFPSPQDRGPVTVGEETVEPNASAPFCARIFKSVHDPFVGQLSYLRVWSGTLKPESEVLNASSDAKERIGRIYLIKGKEQIDVSAAVPGCIVALAKLKETGIGDTLCDLGKQYVFPEITFPPPTSLMAVYSKSRGDEDKISEGFHKLIEEDPTLSADRDPLTNEYIISGLGEVQIQTAVKRLKTNNNVEVDLRTPKVAYKETIRGKGDTKYRHKKQTGGAGQFAEVWMHLKTYVKGEEDAPGKGKRELIELPWGGKLLFVDEVVGGHIPAQLVQSVKKGYISAMEKGVLADCPVIDVTATVYDGKTHPVDSKDIAFQIAGRQGFKECARQAKPVLMEPIMDVSIMVPTEYMGAITGDLNSRRGRVMGINPEGAYQVIKAQVPMAEMLKYTPELRSMTGGKGQFSMEIFDYEEVPANVAQKVIAERKEEEEE